MDLDKLDRQARALVDQGKRVEAIKLVRRNTNWGLRRAKEHVDALGHAELPALSPAEDEALKREIQALVQRGRYTEAVERVRERTGWSLRDCKVHVDMLTKGGSVDWMFVASRASELLDRRMEGEVIEWVTKQTELNAREAQDYVGFMLAARSTHSSPKDLAVPAPIVAQVRELLAQSRKVRAVKLVRILTNWGLRDSKEYVDSLG
jgi:ribosomal protein L7/L12